MCGLGDHTRTLAGRRVMKAHCWLLGTAAGLSIGCNGDGASLLAPEPPATVTASAVPGCIDVAASGQTFAINAFTFKSFNSVQATLDGVTTPVAVTTYLLGAPTATDDGTLLARTSHV